MFDVNVNGLFYCNRFVARAMKARGYGRIVNIASIAGKEGNPTASAYSASKAAVIGLTKSLGKELAKNGVCVNAITPATIETPMLAQVSARISTTCARRSRWSDSAKSRKSRRWCAGWRAANARSAPARCSIFRAGERRTEGAAGGAREFIGTIASQGDARKSWRKPFPSTR